MTDITQNHFYGRRRSRRMHTSRQQAFDDVQARFFLAKPEMAPPATLDPHVFFDGLTPTALWLEIGFGHGEHLVHQASLHPSIGLLGIEPFLHGIATAALAIADRDIPNIRIYPDDAMHVLPHLVDGCFDRVFLFFPDPWPKVRHHKRRFIQNETVALLARLLRDGGTLHIATDIPELATWMQDHILANPAFARDPRRTDSLTPPADWVTTKYQHKAIREGRASAYFDFVKNTSRDTAKDFAV